MGAASPSSSGSHVRSSAPEQPRSPADGTGAASCSGRGAWGAMAAASAGAGAGAPSSLPSLLEAKLSAVKRELKAEHQRRLAAQEAEWREQRDEALAEAERKAALKLQQVGMRL